MTTARNSLILFFRVMLLFFYIGFSLAIAAEVYAILERISDFDPSSDSVASSNTQMTNYIRHEQDIPIQLGKNTNKGK